MQRAKGCVLQSQNGSGYRINERNIVNNIARNFLNIESHQNIHSRNATNIKGRANSITINHIMVKVLKIKCKGKITHISHLNRLSD